MLVCLKLMANAAHHMTVQGVAVNAAHHMTVQDNR